MVRSDEWNCLKKPNYRAVLFQRYKIEEKELIEFSLRFADVCKQMSMSKSAKQNIPPIRKLLSSFKQFDAYVLCLRSGGAITQNREPQVG